VYIASCRQSATISEIIANPDISEPQNEAITLPITSYHTSYTTSQTDVHIQAFILLQVWFHVQ